MKIDDCVDYIKRKTMLYKTSVEYGDYAMNHVLGCAHGCKYPCYAYLAARRFGTVDSYDRWIKPRLVSNTLEILDREIPRLKSKMKSVQLCFTTDPFMYGYEEIRDMSMAVIRKLNAAGIKCTVLTKGVLPESLAGLSNENEYGITLTSLDERFRLRMEPGAATYQERLDALKLLHDKGCKTWVSIEPYPTPNMIEQDLREILSAVGFVDKIVFGRINYSKDANAYKEHKAFFNDCAQTVMAFCMSRKIKYHIKKGTITS
ncbi:radical SAM protein [Pyramidobacter piscolens]|uniref:radical SAM protein n=1 Tax=Pyramidobacter piscolens TaxID=638849 RepID=UPI002AB13E91|nr:radical SAM protein [Pyramidobacter piscolens]